ncbi:unnamed protein product [Polarella glacialis]|uniref:Uncharacterized protein n=1 Tax=Polarella glacialis TaxID=89957 RepID=A0A813G3F6_POLGL|nr:unnamed protein product [Polarella glacialis]
MARSSRTALSLAAVALGLLGLTAPAFTSFALSKSTLHSNDQRSSGRTQRQAEVNRALQPPALVYSQAADGSMLEASGPIVTYSQALFDAAKAKNETVKVTMDVLAMKTKLQDDEFLEKWVLITNNFNIEKKDRSSVLVDLLGPFKSTVVPKFIVFLTKKQRAMSLRRIVKHYVTALYQQQAIEPVTVKSAQRPHAGAAGGHQAEDEGEDRRQGHQTHHGGGRQPLGRLHLGVGLRGQGGAQVACKRH